MHDQDRPQPGATWYLVRHGQTDWNKAGRMQGRTDIPLNDTGRAQAVLAAEELANLRPTAVISSPLSRAQETAQIIATRIGGVEVHIEPGLIERSYGSAEGRDVRGLSDEQRQALMDGGEPRAEAGRRGVQALRELKTRYGDAPVVIISHGALIRVMLEQLTGEPHPRIANAEIRAIDSRLV